MRTTQQLSITLPIEMAEFVRARVKAGDYASESEVIRDGLRALAARDRAVDRWYSEQARRRVNSASGRHEVVTVPPNAG